MIEVLDRQNVTATGFHIDFDVKSLRVNEQGDGDLLLEGYANTWADDRDSEAFLRSAFENAIDKYMLNPVICYQHDRKSVLGRMFDRPVINDIGVRVKALITKPPVGAPPWRIQAYDDIRRGVLKAMSVGGLFYRNAKDFPGKIIGLDWFETSVVSVPANPFAIGAVAGAKGFTFPTNDEEFEPFDGPHFMFADSEEDEKAALLPGVGRGHGAHRHGGAGRRRTHSLRRRAGVHARARVTKRGTPRTSRTQVSKIARGPNGPVTSKNVANLVAQIKLGKLAPEVVGDPKSPYFATAVKSGLVTYNPQAPSGRQIQFKAASELDDTTDNGVDDTKIDIDDLISALGDALDELQGDDTISASDKADAIANLLEEFSDEADDILGDTSPDDTNGEGKALRTIERLRSHGAQRLATFLTTEFAKERTMADEPNKDDTGTGDSGGSGGTTVSVDAKALRGLSEEVERLRAKDREREMEVEAETKAAELLADETAALEAKAAREQTEQQELDRRVEAAMTRQRQAMGTPRKFVHTTGHEGAKSAQSDRTFVDFLKDVREARNGDFDAFGRLREESKGAAASYGIKAMGEGTTTTGGFLVPPQYWQQGLAEFRIAAAKLRPLCTVIQGINSNLVYIPRSTGISTVGWTAENATKPSTDQSFGQISVPIFTLAGISKVSNQLLEDSSPAVDQIVRLDLGRAIGREEDMRYLNGDGINRPVGILQTTGVLTIAYVAGVSGLADAISAAMTAIQTNYFGDPDAIVAHPRNVGILRTAKDANSRYIFTPGWTPELTPHGGGPGSFLGADTAGQNASPVGSVWGLPVVSDANMPTNYLVTAPTGGTESPVIVGKFSEAWILERSGVNVDVSDEAGTSFESNQTWYRAEERQGFTAARQPAAFCYITGLTPTIAG